MTTQLGLRWLRAVVPAVAAVLVLAAAGCGGGDTQQAAPSSTAEATGGPAPAGGPTRPGAGASASTKSPQDRLAELENNDSRSIDEENEYSRLKAQLGTGGGASAPSAAAAGGASSAAAPAAGGGPADKSKPPKRRRDPFAPWWDTSPAPPVLSLIAPVRLAPPHVGEKPPEQRDVEIQEPPTLRVSGMMTGAGVYALLEGAEGQLVVKPGDSVGAYRVESIGPSAVVLKRHVGHVTYTMVVPLSDASLGGAGSYGTNSYGSGTGLGAPTGMPYPRQPGGQEEK